MQRNAEPEARPEKRSLKKGAGLLLSISAISILGFLLVVLSINWPKERIQPESLTPELKTVIDHIPEKSDALIYIGLKDIRESRLWREILPDSLKQAPLFRPKGRLEALITAAKINPTLDIDTLLVTFRRHGYKQQNFLGVVWGPVSEKLPDSLLKANSRSTEIIGGHRCYELDSTLWVSPLGARQLALASSKTMLGEFLVPQGSFFQRDSLSATLISKAIYKSHLWFALPSGAWTGGALQSLTSANEDMKTLGNLNRIKSLALSVKFNDGIEAESEWLYPTRRAAYFASTFLWGAIRLSELSGTRTNSQTKELLNKIETQQNLESVIIHTKLPIDLFLQAKQKE